MCFLFKNSTSHIFLKCGSICDTASNIGGINAAKNSERLLIPNDKNEEMPGINIEIRKSSVIAKANNHSNLPILLNPT